MDKYDNKQCFAWEHAKIVVSNGEVIMCYNGKRSFFPDGMHFQLVLERVMIKLAKEAPLIFKDMYYSLYFSTREYKMAKKIYHTLEIEKFI